MRDMPKPPMGLGRVMLPAPPRVVLAAKVMGTVSVEVVLAAVRLGL